MKFIDYYAVLGVEEQASAEDIKKAYRRLARKYHPDVSKEADAETRFKELGEAYEVLKDPAKRAEYDELRRLGAQSRDGHFQPPPDWEPAGRAYTQGFEDADLGQFSDFFESVFGRRGAAQRGFGEARQGSLRMRGRDVHSRIALFLEEAYQGCDKQLQIDVPEVDDRGLVTRRSRTLNIKIPPGMVQGQQLRLRGQGAPGLGGGENGDLFLQIELAPHPHFTLERRDVYLRLPVAPWEAALGASVTAPTLGGPVRVKIPKGSNSGHKLRLKGKGLPGTPPGDQVIVLQLSVPTQHDAAAEAAYRKLAEAEADFNPRAGLGV